MAKSDQVEKIKLEVDSEELEGLISISEYKIQTGVVDVSGRDKTVPVSDGVLKIPTIPAVFKISKSSRTFKTLQNWFYKKEEHEMTCIRTDGAGKEFARELWTCVQLSECTPGDYDASAPKFARVTVAFLPEDIIPQAAE